MQWRTSATAGSPALPCPKLGLPTDRGPHMGSGDGVSLPAVGHPPAQCENQMAPLLGGWEAGQEGRLGLAGGRKGHRVSADLKPGDRE